MFSSSTLVQSFQVDQCQNEQYEREMLAEYCVDPHYPLQFLVVHNLSLIGISKGSMEECCGESPIASLPFVKLDTLGRADSHMATPSLIWHSRHSRLKKPTFPLHKLACGAPLTFHVSVEL